MFASPRLPQWVVNTNGICRAVLSDATAQGYRVDRRRREGHALSAEVHRVGLRPADFAGLIPLINAFRVTIEYKKPVYWRGDAGYFPLTTIGVLRREQARRKSRGWNNCGVFGPDGPDYY